ncbi:hypothetical protein F5B22DRAFT_560916 [Xylaria bambusicola]|uniref:uncharacterized protein n=1 Tax=Xylaria bambusicola TaxID=326684 RepID=UPI00200868BB|nr:uncharacterized protein F5B22DRAFT_560916 [Xylaria bambusicola]KAI0503230.1 hypothetical protein F5B22DRAFT_560916 [Xylaria bambusicola]
MAQTAATRLIVCVDDSDYAEDGTLGHGNASNLFRLHGLAATGSKSIDCNGRSVSQTVRYHQAVKATGTFARLQTRTAGSIDQQVKHIIQDICQRLSGPQPELFLYGSGRGGYIVQVVASLLHFLGTPKSMDDFDQLYQTAIALEGARKRNDALSGGKLTAYLQAHCYEPPKIQFLGVFDALRTEVEKYEYESSFVDSVQNFRHALAFSDTHTTPCVWPTPAETEIKGRSFTQAWFMGAHLDICGGSEHDGLSLFPLQWMLLESIKAGLLLRQDQNSAATLSLIFPQFAGRLPDLEAEEKAHWRIKYVNGIEATMFDLQSVQLDSKSGPNHSIPSKLGSGSQKNYRKVFSRDSNLLLGWSSKSPCGSIIHPSMYAVLDRNARYYDQGIFKARKKELSGFLEYIDDQDQPHPWLAGLALQDTGVKAFRILVCGKTGVGKSTLINKVFGVEMTEESTTYSQGVHDINQAFENPNHPGLLIHDSRGWQAGSDAELEEIAKFLRHRAFQKNPAEALHVIWFCVNSDVSRIEEADRRTFEIIAQYSSDVPVFVVGTKKDRLIAFRKMELLEEYMEKTGDYKEANRLATEEANEHAEKQFLLLRDQLSNLDHYKADGYSCISKDDDAGIRKLIGDTVDLIADERVRVFCVAAQVVDVEQKIDQAITEVMRLGAHAIRTAMVPLPASGLIGTPTVSRILCEHVIQCFGFPKVTPEAVEEIMSQVVMKNLKSFMRVSLTQFASISAITLGAAIPSGGIGVIAGIAGCILSTPPTARMLLKCACDMILILERSFRYQKKYVSVKQLEDAAAYYTTAMTKKLDGTPILLQQNVHDQVDNMIPLRKVGIGFKFATLRSGLQDIIYMNRYDKESQSQLPSRVSSNQIQTPSRLPSLDKPNTPTPPPVSEAWRDWNGENVRSTPAWQSENTRLSPPYKPLDPEANMKFLGITPVGRPVAELDSNPAIIRTRAAELHGTSISGKPAAAVAELEGDYGLPQQTHPDYASSPRHIPQMPSMRLVGTLYTPADDAAPYQQWPTSNINGIMGASTPDLAARSRSPTNLAVNTLSPSTEDLTIRKKKSSSNLLKSTMGKFRFKKS